jgi:hypothetical protein
MLRRRKILVRDPVLRTLLSLVSEDEESFARALGYHVNTLASWRLGRRKASYLAVVDLAQFFGYEITLTPRRVSNKIPEQLELSL